VGDDDESDAGLYTGEKRAKEDLFASEPPSPRNPPLRDDEEEKVIPQPHGDEVVVPSADVAKEED
jgi:hypothetical protein